MKNSFKLHHQDLKYCGAVLKPSITTLDVNEQNMQALGFCEKRDFGIAGCSEKDAERKDYPILHLKLQNEIINDISGCNKGCKSHNLLIYTLICGERGK